MPLVDAFLAFALTMLSLATIVTLAMEFFHQFAGQRTKGLRRMLSAIFEREVLPWIGAKLDQIRSDQGRVPDSLADAYAELIGDQSKFAIDKDQMNALTENPVVRGKLDSKDTGGLMERWAKHYRKRIGTLYLKSMTKDEFLMRMADLPFMKLLAESKELKVDLKELNEKIDATYDSFADLASESFGRNARIWSFVLGIILAFAFNVNAVTIFNYYLENPEATAAIIKDAEDLVANTDAALKEAEARKASGETAGQGGDDSAGSAGPTIEDLKKTTGQLRGQIEELRDRKLPIGPFLWGLFDQESPSADSSPNQAASIMLNTDPIVGTILTLLAILVTGLMIGLGGPFWRRAVQGIIESRRLLKPTK